MDFVLSAKFKGDEAEFHRIPAYEGAQSIQGIARGFVLAGHYLTTGIVRQRAPFDSGVRIFIRPPREGSLDQLFQFVSEPSVQLIGGVIAENVTSSLIVNFIKYVFSRAVGIDSSPSTPGIEELENSRPGDIDALIDATLPTLNQGHTAIENGVQKIIIIHGDNNIVSFNEKTKRYINQSNLNDEMEIQDLSIGSFNVNSGYGRAYFHDLGKTVPFNVHKRSDPGTQSAIAYSLDQYANRLPSDIKVRFLRITSVDGRTKKILIVGARRIADDEA